MPHKDPEERRRYIREYKKRYKHIIHCTCQYCGKAFDYNDKYGRGPRKYCDNCRYISKRMPLNISRLKELYVHQQFSLGDVAQAMGSKACTVRLHLIRLGIRIRSNAEQQKINFALRPEKHVGDAVDAPCQVCGEITHRILSALKPLGVFCSKECFDIFQTIRDFEVRYGQGWAEAKRKIRERDKTCQYCGKTSKEIGRALDVHHIQPMRLFNDKAQAHDLANLIALCPSCHKKADNKLIRQALEAKPSNSSPRS